MIQNQVVQNSGKIMKLTLNGHQIIQGNESEDFLSNGSYLMFPWVNRLSDKSVQCIFRDSNGYPLHGLYCNQERKIISEKKNEIIQELLDAEGKVLLLEKYRFMNEKQFSIECEILDSTLEYGIGYHPYFSFDNIDEITLETNLTHQLKVDEYLIPVGENLEWDQVNLKQAQLNNIFFDSCFKTTEQRIYIKLISKQYTIILEFDDFFQYCQIYTPPDRKRIAIEPQSSTADCFKYKTYKKGQSKFCFTITIE